MHCLCEGEMVRHNLWFMAGTIDCKIDMAVTMSTITMQRKHFRRPSIWGSLTVKSLKPSGHVVQFSASWGVILCNREASDCDKPCLICLLP